MKKILLYSIFLLNTVLTIYPQNSEWKVYKTALVSNLILGSAEYEDGNKWIGTSEGGVSRFDGSNWTTYTSVNSGLSSNSVISLEIDKTGDLWVGSRYGGVAKFDGIYWAVYNSCSSSLPNNIIWSIAIDSSGNKWIGTDANGGIVKFDKALYHPAELEVIYGYPKRAKTELDWNYNL